MDRCTWTVTPVTTAGGNSQAVVNALDQIMGSLGDPYNAQQGGYFAMLGDNKGTGVKLSETFNDTAGGLLLTYYVASDGYSGNSFSAQWNGITITGSSITNVTGQTMSSTSSGCTRRATTRCRSSR